ncbi:MAG TPA: N-acetyl-gamma-glutamyl-phosphate reductase [Planctomycetaceae bacterium]|nr:N-acetyl-gamma-glutamyl-phosphate reductase [Planctomycetaceae bacterium]
MIPLSVTGRDRYLVHHCCVCSKGENAVSIVRAGILGATGYTAVELLKILLRHPLVEVVLATSRQDHGKPLSEVHPLLAGRTSLQLENFEAAAATKACDVVFSCLPHAASATSVQPLVDAGIHVIDFSADYRLNDVATYETWYGGEHPDPTRVGQVPYGLPELFADEITNAKLVANPGCFPTSAILPLAPLLLHEQIQPQGIIVDAKTGVTGAGRTPKQATLFPECNESIAAYAVGTHRHGPEIRQILSRRTGVDTDLIFIPHLVPMDRGILSTIYARPMRGVSAEQVMECWREFYEGQPFIRVVDHLPATKFTSDTNYCDLAARDVEGTLVLIASIDNLGKGASGAAVQNLNQVMGWDATLGF